MRRIEISTALAPNINLFELAGAPGDPVDVRLTITRGAYDGGTAIKTYGFPAGSALTMHLNHDVEIRPLCPGIET
jgi:hypothetical protein